MAALTQEQLFLLARHQRGIGRLLSRSRIDPSKVLVIIAHVECTVGRGFLEAGVVPVPTRSSVVLPMGIEAASVVVPAVLDPEVLRGAARHGATALVVFGREGPPGLTFERFTAEHRSGAEGS